ALGGEDLVKNRGRIALTELGGVFVLLLIDGILPQGLLARVAVVSPHTQADTQQHEDNQEQNQRRIRAGGIALLDGFLDGHGTHLRLWTLVIGRARRRAAAGAVPPRRP